MARRSSLEISRSVHCLWREPNVRDGYATAVSLHSHTMHSREGLGFVPRVLRRAPLAHAALQRIEEWHRREHGKPIPFERAFWRLPLNPQAAHDLEAAQIRNLLGLCPLVSLTDHDSLAACAELHTLGIQVPYSLEWTVPYHGTVFHIGVHNLPPERARGLEAAVAAATAAPVSGRVAELLAEMHAMPEVLLVLNHPFSCEGFVERAAHVRLLMQFLGEFGGWIHALELNGLQPKVNNINTIRLAAERDVPVISGGDRQCCEPNANLNLTNAGSFVEFVREIRVERCSFVLFLPQYRDPVSARYVEFIWHAVRSYPEFAGRARWVDRVFFQRESGEIVTCGSLWPNGGPAVIRGFISVIGFLASPGMRAVHCMAMGRAGNAEPGMIL
jgi:hypothetical protein